MAKKRRAPLDAAFAALANPTRRKLLKQLLKGEQSITQLAAKHDQTFWAISKHLTALEEARLVERRSQGRSFLFRASTGPLRAIRTFLAEVADAPDGSPVTPSKRPAKGKDRGGSPSKRPSPRR